MSTRPRDIVGYERGRAHRDAIREVMLAHVRGNPLRRHLSGKEVQTRLSFALKLSTVLWHMAAIYAEAETEAARDLALENV
jgi:hypothetical protein